MFQSQTHLVVLHSNHAPASGPLPLLFSLLWVLSSRGPLSSFMQFSVQMSPPRRSLPFPLDPEGLHVRLGRLFTAQSLIEGRWNPGHVLLSKFPEKGGAVF